MIIFCYVVERSRIVWSLAENEHVHGSQQGHIVTPCVQYFSVDKFLRVYKTQGVICYNGNLLIAKRLFVLIY